MTGLTNPVAKATSWVYLNIGWLLSKMLASGVSNRLSMTATLNTSCAPASCSGTTGYTYDYGSTTASARRSQITQEASSRGGSYTNTFGYDGSTTGGPGNPTSFKGTTTPFPPINRPSN